MLIWRNNKMAYCNNCGASISDNAKFYQECGSLIERDSEAPHIEYHGTLLKCPNCQGAVNKTTTVCPYCGYQFHNVGSSITLVWLPVPTGSLSESSFWTRSGAMNMSATPGPWTCTSRGSARRSTTTRAGRSPQSGASATNSRPIPGQNSI